MIGRKQEVKELNRLYNRNKAELVAIYGRRRVGKTYLVDETFEGKITFRHAGLSPADENSKGLLRLQLDHFYNSLNVQGMEKCEKPKNWLDAFVLLEKFLQNRDDGSRQVIFLDELPWLDTPKSGFVERFLELSLFYRLFSPLDSEMICIFPYFCPYAESAREIREIFV